MNNGEEKHRGRSKFCIARSRGRKTGCLAKYDFAGVRRIVRPRFPRGARDFVSRWKIFIKPRFN